MILEGFYLTLMLMSGLAACFGYCTQFAGVSNQSFKVESHIQSKRYKHIDIQQQAITRIGGGVPGEGGEEHKEGDPIDAPGGPSDVGRNTETTPLIPAGHGS